MDNPPITQETFDQVVNENIEDLDMDPEEAVTDAIEQLREWSFWILEEILEISRCGGKFIVFEKLGRISLTKFCSF